MKLDGANEFCAWVFKALSALPELSWTLHKVTQPDLKHFLTRRFASCKTWVVFKHQEGTPLINQDSLIHSLKDHKLQLNTIIRKNYNLSFCQQTLNPDRKCLISRCLPLQLHHWNNKKVKSDWTRALRLTCPFISKCKLLVNKLVTVLTSIINAAKL